MDITQILEAVETGGLLGLLLVIIVGGAKKWWVYGWQYRDVTNDRNEWKDIALDGMSIANKAGEIAGKAVQNRRRN